MTLQASNIKVVEEVDVCAIGAVCVIQSGTCRTVAEAISDR